MNNFFKNNLIIISIILFILVLFPLRHYVSIFYFQNDLNKISINVETKNNSHISNLYVCFNQNCDKMNLEKGIYTYKLNQTNPLFYNGEIDDIELIFKDESLTKNIQSITVFCEKNFGYYSINETIKSKIEFQNEEYTSYKIPFKIVHKNLLQKMSIYIESIFYNWYFYIFSYILIIIYLSKNKFNYNFNLKILPIFLIISLGFLLRLSHIDFIPLWNDELYTICNISNGTLNLKRTIMDPGNPPLFFILSNIWLTKFNSSIIQIRFLPLILGLIQIGSIYFITNKVINKKTALVATFLSAINIFIIVESNEIRSYILSMSLILWGGYSLLNIKKDFSYKNCALYVLFTILLINTHYYTLLFALFNFILGFFILKNKKIKFTILNILAFSTFLPYLQSTMMLHSFEKNFNTWLEKPDLTVLYNHVIFYFGNILFLICTVAFCIFIYNKHLKNKFEGKIFIYNIISISFVFIASYIISLTIKPILFERYFCIFLPLLIINTAILINIKYKIKFTWLIILLFSINMPKYENYNLFSNIDNLIKYSIQDYKNYKYENVYFIIPDTNAYLKYYPEMPKDRVIISNLGTREDKDLIKEYVKEIKKYNPKTEKIVLYLPEICINSKIKYSKKENIKKINTSILPIYKIFLE